MSCSIVALVACFSWSGFYVDGGMVVADSGEVFTNQRYHEVIRERKGVVETTISEYRWRVDSARNPYGRLSLGYEIEFSPQIKASFQLSHQSSLDTDQDRGVNSASLSLRWYPFRRQ